MQTRAEEAYVRVARLERPERVREIGRSTDLDTVQERRSACRPLVPLERESFRRHPFTKGPRAIQVSRERRPRHDCRRRARERVGDCLRRAGGEDDAQRIGRVSSGRRERRQERAPGRARRAFERSEDVAPVERLSAARDEAAPERDPHAAFHGLGQLFRKRRVRTSGGVPGE